MLLVSFPDPTFCEEKGLVNLDRFDLLSLVWPALRARADKTVLNQISDLIGQEGCAGAGLLFNLYRKQWHCG